MKPLAKPESNAYDLTFAEIELQERTALFTESRVQLNSIPLPLARYEIRHADEREHRNASVQKSVDYDYLGTVLTQHPLELDNFHEVDLADSCIDFYPRTTTSLDDFIREHNIDPKPRSKKSTRSIGYAEFEDDFAGGDEYGYHLSLDGSQLMRDDDITAYFKALETEKHVFFHREEQLFHREEEFVVFRKTEGPIADLTYDSYCATGDLSDALKEIWQRTSGETITFIDEFMRDYLSKAERDLGWEMPRKDPTRIDFNAVGIFGVRAIFTEESIQRDSIPKSLHLYELGGDVDGPKGMLKVAKSAHVNFRGTLLAEHSLNLGANGEAYITQEAIFVRSDTSLSLKQFYQEVGVRAKPPKDYER